MQTPIGEIDAVLHEERIDRTKAKVTYEDRIGELPDGSFIVYQGRPALVAGERLYPWTPFGYEEAVAFPVGGRVQVLTPRSIVRAFQAGYEPQITLENKLF
jgi:hypothetical protein